MKNVITLMLGLFLTTSAYADITGNIGYQNDYVFRGVNQTQSGGSLSTQVIVDSNGFYGGVSASQVDFGDEVDSDWLGMLNAGFAFAFNQNVAIDIGVLSHHFDNDYLNRWTRYTEVYQLVHLVDTYITMLTIKTTLQSCYMISILEMEHFN